MFVKSEDNQTLIEAFLNSHYSVREFTDQNITQDTIERIIKISRRSPTSSNLQMCSILTVREKASKERLAELCGNQDHIIQSGAFFVFLADLHPLASLCRERNYPFKGEYLEFFILATVDAALCAGRALLGAQALGLSGVLVGAIRNQPREVAKFLNLPDFCYAVCGMSVGYAVKDGKTKPRISDSGMHHQEKYQHDIFDPQAKKYDELISRSGLYKNRRVPLGVEEHDPAAPYSWREHSARRVSLDDPLALRVALKPFLEEIGFKLK